MTRIRGLFLNSEQNLNLASRFGDLETERNLFIQIIYSSESNLLLFIYLFVYFLDSSCEELL